MVEILLPIGLILEWIFYRWKGFLSIFIESLGNAVAFGAMMATFDLMDVSPWWLSMLAAAVVFFAISLLSSWGAGRLQKKKA